MLRMPDTEATRTLVAARAVEYQVAAKEVNGLLSNEDALLAWGGWGATFGGSEDG